MNKPLIIIGTGLAGYMLAKQWRKYDTTTALVMISQSAGDFYSKPLLSTALTNKRSPDDLIATKKEVMAEKLTASILAQTSVTAIDIDKHVVKTNEGKFEYGDLVLACGAKIKHPPLKKGLEHLVSVNHIEDYVAFRQLIEDKKRVAIIGAGLVGCEFANDLINHGIGVDVIEMQHHPVARFLPAVVGEHLRGFLAEAGVSWHLGQQIDYVEKDNDQFMVGLKNGELITADLVFSAIGLEPQIELAKAGGLQTQRGIIVDQYLKTSAEHVYALGDCAQIDGQVQLFVAPILNAARALAKTLTPILFLENLISHT